MKPIIPPVNRKLLREELTENLFLRNTNFAGNQLYAFTTHQAPNLMRELGRLREITFRAAGGGTGEEIDIDYYDTCARPYSQLIVWNPEREEIIGGYRFIRCDFAATDANGSPDMATTHLFRFSETFTRDYLPYTIELGRSFVQPDYQATKENRSGLYALDNLWDGLGALIVKNPDIKYFFGKVTMYNHYNRQARNILLYFMHKYFPDSEQLVKPINPVFNTDDHKSLDALFTGGNFSEDYKILSTQLKNLGENIPPLFNAYMKLTNTMVTFGTSANIDFGPVEETGIMVTIEDIEPAKKERYTGF